MKKMLAGLIVGFGLMGGLNAAEQLGDHAFATRVERPAYGGDKKPVVLVDEAHHNWHTTTGRFYTFANLLRQDGYEVKPLTSPISGEALKGADVLVIANPLHAKNAAEKEKSNQWQLPTPSAFEEGEMDGLVDWVKQGGALLLIADHMPWPGATEKLGYRLGVIMQNAFVFHADFTYQPGAPNLIAFRPTPDKRGDGYLRDHAIVHGRDKEEAVPYVVSFTGQGFRLTPNSQVQPLMVLGAGSHMLYPSEANTMSLQTPGAMAEGLLQGGTLHLGAGRVAIFGEAGMFTAQTNPAPMGINHPEAPHNQQFVLNVLHWLTGVLP